MISFFQRITVALLVTQPASIQYAETSASLAAVKCSRCLQQNTMRNGMCFCFVPQTFKHIQKMKPGFLSNGFKLGGFVLQVNTSIVLYFLQGHSPLLKQKGISQKTTSLRGGTTNGRPHSVPRRLAMPRCHWRNCGRLNA